METKEKADKSTFVSHLLKSAQGMVREPRSPQPGQERLWDRQAEEGLKSICLAVTIFPIILPIQISGMLVSIKKKKKLQERIMAHAEIA